MEGRDDLECAYMRIKDGWRFVDHRGDGPLQRSTHPFRVCIELFLLVLPPRFLRYTFLVRGYRYLSVSGRGCRGQLTGVCV